MASLFKPLFYIFILTTSNLSYAESICPEWITKKDVLPTCAEGNLVAETNPVAAIVISDKGVSGENSQFAVDVVQKTLIAAGDKTPLFILPVQSDTINKIKLSIDKMHVSDQLKAKYKSSLLKIEAQPFTWQQDYFQPFINKDTGKLTLKPVQNYYRQGDGFKKIIEGVKGCELIEEGPQLNNNNEYSDGYSGGNIETLPLGICLFGNDNIKSDSDWNHYADQICAEGEQSRIKVPTDWLAVGHTDEIVKVVRNKKAKAPCDFSVAVASPKEAIEILRKNPKQPFLDFSNDTDGSPFTMTSNRIENDRQIRKLCLAIIKKRKESPPANPQKKNDGVTKIFKKLLNSFGFSEASASVKPELEPDPDPHQYARPATFDMKSCNDMTNGEVYQLLVTDKNLAVYNQLIQNKMDSLKKEITIKIKNKNSRCEVDFIDVPNLFLGQLVEKSPGKYELPSGSTSSLLPNPTNAITVEDTIISPNPSNESFKKYLEEQYSLRGLKSEFVDTYDQAHIGLGNLHCVTNTIHICNPKGIK